MAAALRRRLAFPHGRGATCLLLAFLSLLSGPGSAIASEAEESAQEPPPARTEASDPEVLSPKLTIHGFGDVNAVWEKDRMDTGESTSHNRFELGTLSLYLISHLAENISFLGEIVFEDAGQDESKVEVERFSIKYRVSDLLFVSLGRHHTPLGFWNEAYHHGRVLQPTVERPEVLKWEDMGGILPVHSIGVNLGGRWFRGNWGLDYEAALWNGRGVTPDDIQAFDDLNNQKAVTLRLTLSREKRSRLLFGPMIDLDTIPANPLVSGREAEMSERILGGHLVYRDDRLEVLSEGYRVHHSVSGNGPEFSHTGYFAIAVWRVYKLKPYAGYDRLNIDLADPYFLGLNTDLKRVLIGLRWDLHPFSTFKFEYHRDERPGVQSNVFSAQAGFTF